MIIFIVLLLIVHFLSLIYFFVFLLLLGLSFVWLGANQHVCIGICIGLIMNWDELGGLNLVGVWDLFERVVKLIHM